MQHVAAIIEMSANAVSLVTYRVEATGAWPIHREHVDVVAPQGNVASASFVSATLAALGRYLLIVRSWPQVRLFVLVAPDLCRDGRNAGWIKAIRNLSGADPVTQSDLEVVELCAFGAAVGFPGLEGVVLSVTGSIIGLATVCNIRAPSLLSLGVDPILAEKRLEHPKADFAEFGGGNDTLIVVGGALTALGMLHMRLSGYPLHIIDGYEISTKQAYELCRLVEAQSRSSLDRLVGIPRRHIDILPQTSRILRKTLEITGSTRVVFSRFGRREGLLRREGLWPVAATSNLVAEAHSLMETSMTYHPIGGAAIGAWVATAFAKLHPVFAGDREAAIIAATASLAPMLLPKGAHWIDSRFQQVLRLPLAGLTHIDRSFMAAAVLFAEGQDLSAYEQSHDAAPLSAPAERRAWALGLAMGLGLELTAGGDGVLDRIHFDIKSDSLRLTIDRSLKDILTTHGRDLAKALAKALGRDLILDTV